MAPLCYGRRSKEKLTPMTTTEAKAAPRDDLRGYFYGFLGVCIFGLTLPTTRIAVAELDPLFISCGRALLAGLVSGLLLWTSGRPLPTRAQFRQLMVVAAGVVFGFPALSSIAMRAAPAGHGAIVLALLPLATAAASVLFAGERPSLGFWLFGLAGSAAVLAFAGLEGAFSSAGLGAADLLLVAAIIAASIGYAQGGALSRTLGGWQVICWALVISLPVLAPAVALLLPYVNWHASWHAWSSFLYVAFFSQLIGFFCWNKGLALGGVAKVGQVQLLQTFVSLVGAALLNGESVGPREIGFAALVVAIVTLGRKMPVAHRP
jgi:drug/metabolite transporter (DMT)-like permease